MAARSADRYFELKSEIHRKLIGVLNMERVSSIPKDRLRAEIGRVVERLLDEERVPMTTAEQTKIVEEVLDEVLGLGPRDHFVVAATAGTLAKTLVGRRVEARGSTEERVCETGQAQRVGLLDGSSGFGLAPLGVSATSVLAVPLGFRRTTLGVIEALDRVAGPQFGDEDERLLLGAAASAGTAIATAQSVGRDRVRRTMQAAENERRRWARELHDDTLQALAGLRVLLSTAQRSDDDDLFRRATGDALDQLDTEIESLRVLISELRPAALDELGLRAALVALAERTSVRHGVDVTTAIDQPRDSDRSSGLDSERETVVYRVVQEALTNAARHARSESVAVRLGQRNGEVHVSITDDGGGFDTTAPTEGFGLVGMRERVSLVGGRFELTSSSGGTTVAVSLPARSTFPDSRAVISRATMTESPATGEALTRLQAPWAQSAPATKLATGPRSAVATCHSFPECWGAAKSRRLRISLRSFPQRPGQGAGESHRATPSSRASATSSARVVRPVLR